MGREKKRKKTSALSDIDEREKVKESILKVFRAHHQSPSQEGAIVVGEPKKSAVKCAEYSSDESMSGRSKSKGRTSRRKKTGKKASPSGPDTAITKHLKIAHGMVYKHGREKEEAMLVHRPGPSRLTQKVGIFNLGKKSKPATRGSGMFVPDHILKQTEADLQKIVHEANIDNPSTVMSISDHSVHNSIEISSARVADSGSLPGRRTPSDRNTTLNTACETVTRSNGSELKTDIGLEPLNLTSTLVSLMIPLGPLLKRFTPGRDYSKETVVSLKKLFKQNAPRSATPTPIPALSKIKTSGGIQRNLFGDTEYQQHTDIHKSPGPSSAKLCVQQNTSQRTIPANTSDPAVHYPITHLYDKTLNLYDKITNHHTDYNKPSNKPSHDYDKPPHDYNKPPHDYRQMGVSDNDMQYYRSKVLGTDRRDSGVCMGSSGKYTRTGGNYAGNNKDYMRNNVNKDYIGNNKDYIGNNKDYVGNNKDCTQPYCDCQPNCDINSKHTWPFIQSNKHRSQNTYIDTNRHADTGFDLDKDCHMLTDDDFDPFLIDIHPSKSMTTASLPRDKDDQRMSTIEMDFPRHVLPATIDESSMKITKPISPLLGALSMLEKNETKVLDRQKFGRTDRQNVECGDRHNYEQMECETVHGNALSLLQKNDMMKTDMMLYTHEDRRSKEDDCRYREGRFGSQGSTGSTNNSQQKMQYMPGFHSDFYIGSSVKDLVWRKPGYLEKTESMDILDHVDLDYKMDTHVGMGRDTHVGMGRDTHVGMGRDTHVGMGRDTHVGMGQDTHVGVGRTDESQGQDLLQTESMDILDHVDLDYKMDTHVGISHNDKGQGQDLLQVASLNTRTYSLWNKVDPLSHGA